MKWEKEAILELIECYKEHSVIWDAKHPMHYNKVKRENAWIEVSKEMKETVEECKKKMDSLLSGLRRERMKMKNRKNKGDEYESSWYVFKSLQFLFDRNKPKTTISAIEENRTKQLDTPEESVDTTNTAKSTLKRKRESNDDEPVKETFKIVESPIIQTANDDSQHFGNMVAAKLRNYDEATRCMLQHEIMTVFLNMNLPSI